MLRVHLGLGGHSGRLAGPANASRSAACRVSLGEVTGCCLRSGAGVALQRAHRGVPRPGQQQRQVGAILGGVGEGRVAQLMQRPPGAGMNSSAARRYDSRAHPLVGSRSRPATARVGRRSSRKTGPLVRPASSGGAAGLSRSVRTPTPPHRPCCAPGPAGWPGPGPPRPGPGARGRGRRSHTAAATAFAPAARDRGGQAAAPADCG